MPPPRSISVTAPASWPWKVSVSVAVPKGSTMPPPSVPPALVWKKMVANLGTCAASNTCVPTEQRVVAGRGDHQGLVAGIAARVAEVDRAGELAEGDGVAVRGAAAVHVQGA